MIPIHYKEDFKLVIDLESAAGVPAGVPEFDFTVRLRAGNTDYFAGRFDGDLVRCAVEGDRLIIICDNHRLAPCKTLCCDITYHLPDTSMPDGVRDIVRSYDTGASLINRHFSPEEICSQTARFSALLPYIKGDPMMYADLSEDEKIKLAGDIAEALRMDGDIGNACDCEPIPTEEIDRLWGDASQGDGDNHCCGCDCMPIPPEELEQILSRQDI